MEKYIINGVEVEYDTFDLDNMERFDSERAALQEKVNAAEFNGVDSLREQAENILDFFDAVLYDGAAHDIFGDRVNIRDIIDGYRKFGNDVMKAVTDWGAQFKNAVAVQSVAPNREQRRAAERAQRLSK